MLGEKFCNCCGKLKPIGLASTPDTVFCKKCANYQHRQKYYSDTGMGCKGF